MTTRLTLFLAGITPDDTRLATAIRRWCDRELGGDYRLDVLDVRRWPLNVENIPVLVTPALSLDGMDRVVVGELTDIPAVMAALGLNPHCSLEALAGREADALA